MITDNQARIDGFHHIEVDVMIFSRVIGKKIHLLFQLKKEQFLVIIFQLFSFIHHLSSLNLENLHGRINCRVALHANKVNM